MVSYRSGVFLSAMVIMLATGCIADKCGSVRCDNEGVCVQGTGACACAYAYEGDFCENKWHDKFEGQWTSSEVINKTPLRTYPLQLITGPGPDSFLLLNFAESVDTVFCTRKAYNVFSMQERILPDSSKLQGGEGTYNPETGTVTGLYSFAKQDVITNISFTWSK